jgi:glycosyltransferase involved in cell wall biosynthesis
MGMTRIAIVSPNILPGDAIGHDALHMGRTLSARGHEVELFSTNFGKPLPRSPDDLLVHEYLDDDPAALLILHHAIGWKHALPLISEAKCRRVVKYHNVTPAHFYEHLDRNYADLCRLGRSQMHELVTADCDLYLADSPFNRNDLLDMDVDPDRCLVVPPFNDIENLRQIEPDPEVLRDYGDGRTTLLFVGRRAPNKGHRFLIDAFSIYHTHHDCNSRLVLLGKGEPEPADYTAALRARVRQLGLQGHVIFLDGATGSELRGYYETASAFVLASEHEGFCVPAVEAMALGVPAVGYGSTAVPGTVGDAGLLWPEPDPFLLAQSVAEVVRDGATRRALIERGRRRYREQFANSSIRERFLHALQPLLTVPARPRQDCVFSDVVRSPADSLRSGIPA